MAKVSDYTDAELGAIVRKEAERFIGTDQNFAAYGHAAAMALIMATEQIGSTQTTVAEQGVTFQGIELGDYEVRVVKIGGGKAATAPAGEK